MSLLKSSILFSVGTFFSRLSGLLREAVLGSVFGASYLLDSFLIAFRIPNLFRDMLADGALGTSFTKVYSQLNEIDRARASALIAHSLALFAGVGVLVSSIGILTASSFVDLMTLNLSSGYPDDFISITTSLTRILFPFLALSMVSSILMGALHEKGSFFISAVSPICFNLGYILGAWKLSVWFDLYLSEWLGGVFDDLRVIGLAVGVMLGGLSQVVIQLYVIRKSLAQSFRYLRISIWTKDIEQVLVLMLPAAIAAGSGPINVFVNTNFATSLGEGAVSWLSFAFRLLQLPIGLFGVAVGVVALPALSRIIANSSGVNSLAIAKLQEALGLVIFFMSACFVVLVVNYDEVIRVLFNYGSFSERDVHQTGRALWGYSFGLFAYGLIKVLTSFYYSIDRTSYAMKVSLIGIIANFIANYLLVDIWGHVGLSLASSVTLSINALMLILGLNNYYRLLNWAKVSLFLIMIGGATCLLCLLTYNIKSQLLLSPFFQDLRVQSGFIVGVNSFITVIGFFIVSILLCRDKVKQLLLRKKV